MLKSLWIFGLLLMTPSIADGQNEASKWFFGNKCGLDFNTSPPSILSVSSMSTGEGSASIADNTGNLLFYTNAETIWNKQHVIMANGSGLLGNSFSQTTQAAVILKIPASLNQYIIFTQSEVGASTGFRYSIVDMGLSAGMGSVTVKNVPLYTPCSEQLSAIKHCNGTDYWIVVHPLNQNKFFAFLLTASGVNSIPVTTTIGNSDGGHGNIKFSPQGNKMAMTIFYGASGSCELYDFNQSTGTVSNLISLNSPGPSLYGAEFSPDGTKLYATVHFSNTILQWDLCTGSSSAIAASQYSISTTPGILLCGLQLAGNGKIYLARDQQNTLGVINSPNLAGAACNFSEAAQPLGNGISAYGLPNFCASIFRKSNVLIQSAASASLGCTTVSLHTGNSLPCNSSTFQPASFSWNFGDPNSSANTSTLSSPSHSYPVPGNYSVQLSLSSNCYTDVIQQVITVPNFGPTLTVSGKTTVCSGEATTLTAAGANTYTWNNVITGPVITITPSSTTVYTLQANDSSPCAGAKSLTVTVLPCSGLTESENKGISIYPNPSDGLLYLENEDALFLTLSDLNGKILLQNDYGPGKRSIFLADLTPGVYFLHMQTAGGFITRKLILN